MSKREYPVAALEAVLRELHEDYVDLDFVSTRLQGSLGQVHSDQLREQTLSLVRHLLIEDLVKGGLLGSEVFEEWGLSADETIARINSEWDALGRPLNCWDIVWFGLTEKGKVVAEKLHRAYRKTKGDGQRSPEEE